MTVHAPLRHLGGLLRLQQATQVRENHAVARGEARAHRIVRVQRDRLVPERVRGALGRAAREQLVDFAQLRIIFEEVAAIIEAENGVVVEMQELGGRRFEPVFIRL